MNNIEISELSKSFNEKIVLSSISLSLQEGEIFGLLGPSGKTTMMWYNELQDVFGNGNVKHVKPRG